MEMAFGIFGLMGFVFGLTAFAKVVNLEKELKEKGVVDVEDS